MSAKFRNGDRVVCIGSRQYPWLDGITGTFLDGATFSSSVAHVRWDRKISELSSQDGHTCDGRCELGYGWNIRMAEIELCPDYEEGEDICVADLENML